MSADDARAAWVNANQVHLRAALDRLRRMLEQGRADEPEAPAEAEVEATGPAPALVTTAELFGLSDFERDVLLLAAGVELDGDLAELCASRPEARGGAPTFALALAALPDAHWSAVTSSAPLRSWRLIELGAGEGPTSRAMRVDERILHHLLGMSPLDERLQRLVAPVAPPDVVAEIHRRLAARVVECWREPNGDGWPVVELLGDDPGGKAAVASLACAELGAPLLRLDATGLPGDEAVRDQIALLWDREAMLTGAVLVIDADELDAEGMRRLRPFARRLRAPMLIATPEPLSLRGTGGTGVVHLDVARPGGAEARELWQAALGPAWASLDGEADRFLGQFALGLDGIRAVAAQVRHGAATREGQAADDLATRIWGACRVQARPRLDGLAQRIEPRAGWDDLVLPDPQRTVLRDLALQLRQRATVYERWGFERQSTRGLGFSALFAGESGTGKTMAGEVLASHLELDLYRIDLSQVVSKYIGETEKNLRRVFDGAEDGGAILLFDEADALFGKRSEVKDSHDRYANIEISYLLQRMEAYRGLAILTTNQKNALDRAFVRRLRFIVQFPFPDESLREAIWKRVFPGDAPVADLDFARLARLDLTGGNIRNVAMAAAFRAADEGSAITMEHLAAAVRGEYTKLAKPIAEIELRRLLAERERSTA